MRNYFAAWWLHYTLVDGSNNQSDQVFVGKDEDDLRVQNEAFIASLDPNQGPYSFEATTTTKAFHLLDKQTFINLLNVSPIFWWFTSVRETNPDSQNILTVLKTPRYTGWKDQSGGVRAAPPSDKKGAAADYSGAAALVSNFLRLMNNLITQARVLKRQRDVGILEFILLQVEEGKLSITDALGQLVQDRLV